MSGTHERVICPHGNIISTCRCMNAAQHTRVVPCPTPERHAGRPVTAGWIADGTRPTGGHSGAEAENARLKLRIAELEAELAAARQEHDDDLRELRGGPDSTPWYRR